MAATISATFRVIDRATGPMKKMEAQALRTKKAIDALGKAQAKQSRAGGGGTAGRSTARQYDDQARGLRNLGNESRRASRDADGLATSLGRTGAALGGVGRIMGLLKWPALAGGVALLGQAITSLGAGALALGPALAQAAAAIAAMPQTIAAAVQGFGTFKLAMGGVSNALKAGMTLATQHTQAMQQTADAQRNAIHSVSTAEFSLQQSQRSATQAQQALTAARRDAVRNLTDMKLAAEGADLSQQRATLGLREARQALAQAAINPQTSGLQFQDLQLNVREAQLAVKQAGVNQNRAHVDQRRAASRGVSGNLSVIAAQNSVTDAMHASSEAAYQLADAQRQAARVFKQGVGPMGAYQLALKNLSPAARTFVKHLVALRPAMMHLRASAAGGLFPGLDRSLNSLQRGLPMLNRLTARTGRVLGRGAERAANRFTNPGRLSDIEGLGKGNDRILNRITAGATNLTAALVDFMVAAQPFTDWLTHTIFQATEWIAKWARANRENGKFAAYLDGTKSKLRLFWDMLKNVGHVLGNLLKAATPLGDRLWKGADAATKGWRKWSDTVTKDGTLRAYFDKQYETLHLIGQLLKDIVKTWFSLDLNGPTNATLTALRASLPQIGRILEKTAGLGPQVVKTATSLATAFADLPMSPLQTMLKLLDKIFRLFDWMIRTVPGLGAILSGILVASALAKSASLVGSLTKKWAQLFGLWRHAPPAPGGGPLGGGGVGGGGGGGGGGGFFGGGGGRGRVRTALGDARAAGQLEREAALAAGAGRAGGLGAFLRGSVRGGEAGGGLLSRLGGIGAGGLLKGGAGVLGKVALPIAGIMALTSFLTAEGSATQKGASALSGATFGGSAAIGKALNLGFLKPKRSQESIDAERAKQAQANSARQARMSGLVDRYGAISDVYQAGGAADRGRGRQRLSQGFALDFRQATGAGKRELSNGVAQWIAVLQKGDRSQRRLARVMTKAVKDSWSDLGRHVQIVNGQVLGGSKREWTAISKAMRDPVERARQEIKAGFTDIQNQAVGSLVAMGMSRSSAKSYVQGRENTAKGTQTPSSALHAGDPGSAPKAKGARGMRIPGHGRQDTVPLTLGMAAPGELIVNRHTERRVNKVLGMAGTSLGREVAGERRPHSAPGGNRYAYGGVTAPVADLISKLDSQGFHHGSTTGGGHAANSYHYKGMAVDFGDASNDMGRLWSVVYPQRAKFAELFGPSYLTPKPTLMHSGVGFSDPALQADHNDHIHLALAGAAALGALRAGAAGAAGAAAAVTAPKMKTPGIAGKLGQLGLNTAAAAMNDRIGAANATGGGNIPNFSGAWTTVMAKIAQSKGWSLGDWKWLVNAESGGDPTAVNKGSGAYGLGQFLGATKTAYAKYGADSPDGSRQINAMAHYIADRYGDPSKAKTFHLANNWYGQGGRTPDWGGWNAKGGTFNVTRPTIFGAGEGGPERVTISKNTAGGHGGVHVEIGHIDFRHPGDIRKVVAAEIAGLADDLDRMGMEAS